jgi:glycosyltransferase involved in cell wall biosynthesis
MQIVYLNPCGKLGGAETSLREVLASIRTAEPDWELWLVLGEDGPLAPIARDLGVRVVVQPFPAELGRLGDAGGGMALWQLCKAAGATAKYARGLAALLARIRPDIIHTNGFKMHLLGAWTRPGRTPLVWHIHDYVSTRRLMSRFLRLFGRSCTVAVANSNSVALDLQSLLPALRVVTIYNGIDLSRFSPMGKKVDLDAAAGLEPAQPGTVRVGLVATFAHWKGHQVFLEALARLYSEMPSSKTPVRGYIIGGPIYQTGGSQWSLEELQQTANRLGLGGKVGFTGFLEDVSSATRSLDIVVHASTQPEPFGMVIIEAMACARPLIASRAGGAAELITEGDNAVSHPPGDAVALAGQIARLASDEGFRERLGKAGRSTAERFYGRDRLGGELISVYRQICGSRGADALASKSSEQVRHGC